MHGRGVPVVTSDYVCRLGRLDDGFAAVQRQPWSVVTAGLGKEVCWCHVTAICEEDCVTDDAAMLLLCTGRRYAEGGFSAQMPVWKEW